MPLRRERTVLALVALVGFLLLSTLAFIYPFGTATPHAELPSEERFWVEDVDAGASEQPHHLTGEIVVDGKSVLAFEDRTGPEGERYQRIADDGATVERYRSDPNATIYKRHTIDPAENVDERRDRIVDDDDRDLLTEETDGDRTVLIVAEEASDPTTGITNPAAVVVRSLHLVAYEPTDDEVAGDDRQGGDGAVGDTFEPRSGWYEGAEAYRVTDAAGAVTVDPETNDVRSASVTWEVANPAGSYAQYLGVRATTSAPMTQEISFEAEDGKTGIDPPEWVPS